MGRPQKPHRVKLVVGVLSNDMGAMQRAISALAKMFGPIDLESAPIDFTHTSYYAGEMGPGLKRKFISFKKLIAVDGAAGIKRRTNRLERALSKNARRTVNIDPGYLDSAKLVLFSTKDYTHRVYAGRGIFAEVTLFYRDGAFNPWPWTYPDYRTDAYRAVFTAIRNLYRNGK